MMKIIYHTVFIICLACVSLIKTDKYRQERAVVKYINPNYIKDAHIITARRNRASPYLTNASATFIHPWGNNVSIVITYEIMKSNNMDMSIKICDALTKTKWVMEFLRIYSRDDYSKCPAPPSTYSFYDVELPPRYFPLPLPSGEYHVSLAFALTATKEKLLEFAIILYINKNNGKK